MYLPGKKKAQVLEAIELYRAKLVAQGYKPQRTVTGGVLPTQQTALSHALWMCLQVPGLDSAGKRARWLGFIQCTLWTWGLFSIDAMRDHNR